MMSRVMLIRFSSSPLVMFFGIIVILNLSSQNVPFYYSFDYPDVDLSVPILKFTERITLAKDK